MLAIVDGQVICFADSAMELIRIEPITSKAFCCAALELCVRTSGFEREGGGLGGVRLLGGTTDEADSQLVA